MARMTGPSASRDTIASTWSCIWKTACSRLTTRPTTSAAMSSGADTFAATIRACVPMWMTSDSSTRISGPSDGAELEGVERADEGLHDEVPAVRGDEEQQLEIGRAHV